METRTRITGLDAKADRLTLQPADIDALVSVCDAVAGQGRLRGALSDPALPGEARAQLATDLLGGRVSSGAVELVAAAAAVCTDEHDLEDLLERMTVRAILRQQGQIDQVADELFRFARMIQADPELQATLTDPRLGLPARQELVGTLLEGKASSQTIALVRRAVAGRNHPLVKTLDGYVELAAQVTSSMIAKVSVAQPLSDDQLAHIKAQLVRIYGAAVDVRVEIVPQVLGGVRIEVGDDVIDGTIQNRLNQARRLIG